MNDIKTAISDAIKDLFNQDIEVELTRPDSQFGDFASNVALQLAKKLGKKPREIAESLKQKLVENESISEVEVAGPGFINITISDKALWELATSEPDKFLDGQTIVAEYSDPNPFKVLHAGHLYTWKMLEPKSTELTLVVM